MNDYSRMKVRVVHGTCLLLAILIAVSIKHLFFKDEWSHMVNAVLFTYLSISLLLILFDFDIPSKNDESLEGQEQHVAKMKESENYRKNASKFNLLQKLSLIFALIAFLILAFDSLKGTFHPFVWLFFLPIGIIRVWSTIIYQKLK